MRTISELCKSNNILLQAFLSMNTLEDKKLIEQLFETLTLAWNTGDGHLFASCFTEDCDYVTFSGEHIIGRQANEIQHQKLFNTFLKGSRLVGKQKSIRFLNPHIAVTHNIGVVKLRWHKTAPSSRQSINTNVLLKQDGVWKITAFHNCRIQKPGFFQKLLFSFFNRKSTNIFIF
jgi:uncharacterized protein (TIGR02246 family)